MSSAGQFIGGAVGAVVGFFVGAPALGAQIGMMVGGAIDPPKGPKIEGPRLSDLSVQTSSYGLAIPRVYGSVALTGNVFWVENNQLKEVSKTESQAGKGGGGPETTTYAYFVTCAIGLCEGPIQGVRRIWVGPKLIYDAGTEDIGTTLAGHNLTGLGSLMVGEDGVTVAGISGEPFTLYYGTENQLPDERMQATLGVANTPAYRGMAYLVLKDYPLADHGNSLLGAQVKVEVITGSEASYQAQHSSITNSDPANANGNINVWFDEYAVRNLSLSYNGSNEYLSVNTMETYYTSTSKVSSSSPLPLWTTGAFDANYTPRMLQSESPCFVFFRWHVSSLYWIVYSASGSELMNSSGYDVSDTVLYAFPTVAVYTNGLAYVAYDSAHKIFALGPYGIVYSTAATYDCTQIGYSENYIFAVLRSTGANTTVYRFDKSLTLVDTYTQPIQSSGASGNTALCVESDDVFYTVCNYTSGNKIIWRWENGVAVDTGCVFSGANWGATETRLAAVAPGMFLVWAGTSGSLANLYAIWKTVTPESVELASIIDAECVSSGLLTSSDIDVSAITADVRGYRVSNVAAIRSALEPLQASWPFDVLQSGYKIKFKPRGGASVATVADSDLIIGSDTPKITHTREMDSQIARRVEVNYLDAEREYDSGAPGIAERLNTSAVNVQQIELPVVLTPDEAAGKAETLLYLYWTERNELTFKLPPTYLNIEPADIVTISANGATYEARITGINYLNDGSLECSAKFNSSAIYTPAAVGQQSLAVPPTVQYTGVSLVQLLDIPVVFDHVDDIGFPVAIYGTVSGWTGATLMQSTDSGQTWVALHSSVPPQATVSTAMNVLGGGRTDIIDTANTIQLQPMTNALSSVTDEQLLAGANHFAFGAHGRWEIIGAKTCTLQGDGSWILSNLLRGRFGTERNTGTHVIYDTAVLLDTVDLPWIGSNTGNLGIERLYKVVSFGASLDSAPSNPWTYSGANLECLNPVYVRGVKAANNDWSMDWVRRTRVDGEWRDRVDVSLGETSEAYEVEIYSSSAYTTLKRTITGLSTSAATYTSAQQTTDFGAAQTTLYVKVYQLSSVVGRGYPATVTLTASSATAPPPEFFAPATDPYWANVVLAMHMNGANGSTTFTDVKGHTMTASGSAITTDTSKFGGASAAFNGTTSYISTPAVSDFLLGSGDFTIRAFVNLFNTQAGTIVGIWSDTSGTGFSWNVVIDYLGVYLQYSTTGSNTVQLNALTSISTGSWHHIEIGRSGTNIYVFLDGVLFKTHTGVSATFYAVASSKNLAIGRTPAGNAYYLSGYLDELQVYKGVCLHTSNFQPPIGEFAETA